MIILLPGGFIRLGFLFIIFVLGYFAIVKGMGAYYGNTNQISDALNALDWDSGHAKAAYNASRSDEVADKLTLLVTSLKNNPADSRAILRLASLSEKKTADQLMRHVGELRPADGDVLAKAASYWFEQGEVVQAFTLWDRALEVTSKYDQQLFPFFLHSLSQSASSEALVEKIRQAKKWWPRFFRFLNAQENALPLMEWLFQQRNSLVHNRSLYDDKILVNRMLREGQIDKAYLTWLNSLDEKSRQGIGLIYDGGFEQTVENYGFGWHFLQGVAMIENSYSVGVKGKKGLHVVFQGKPRPFRHVWQRLRIQQGEYVLNGRARSVSLRTVRGLNWQVSCNGRIVGQSEYFEGNTPWDNFKFSFKIDPNCGLPMLRLVVNGKNPVEYRTRGEIWFDKLEIKRI